MTTYLRWPLLAVTFAGLIACTPPNSTAASSQTVEKPQSQECTNAESGNIRQLICDTPTLAALDVQLGSIYRDARSKAGEEQLAQLTAEQRGWLKGRDECWKADDKIACVTTEYQRRIAELQATYELVNSIGPVRFQCGNPPETPLLVTFYESDTPTLVAKLKGETSLMYQQPAASGSKYQGRNESFWEHQGEVRVSWGYDIPEFVCKKADQ